MAHFAELESKIDPTGFTSDTHLIVKRVVVVDNKHVPSDEHVDGETWCKNFFGENTLWKQTSYHANFRKKYAGIGDVYDPVKNIFLGPQLFSSWTLDGDDIWRAPVAEPVGPDIPAYSISWDEGGQQWTGVKFEDQSQWNWDPIGLAWVAA
tara:strand:+ start:43 stop:495 length:453 start_codon:yes stop_codon:yes gene_type:complete